MRRDDINRLATAAAAHTPAKRWWARAACTGIPLNDFFDDQPSADAQAACAACPVILSCLAAEIGVPPADIHGYRAGVDASLRRRILSEAARVRRPDDRAERMRIAVEAAASATDLDDVAAAVGVSRRTVQRWIAAA